MKVPIAPGDRDALPDQEGDRRLGIGEFVDAGGVMRLLIGRRQYLEAMAIECETPLVQLVNIWCPCIAAMQSFGRELRAIQEAEGVEPASPPAPPAVEALLGPLEDLLGIPFPHILRVLYIGPTVQPIPSVPADSPAGAAANAALPRAFHGHADWMTRWGLPTGDVGWCIFTACMGASWASEAINKCGDGPHDTQPMPEQASLFVPPDLALFDPDRMHAALTAVFGPIEEPFRQILPTALGRWVADFLVMIRDAGAPITISLRPWNPWLETRADANARLQAEAKQAIAAQLDTTEDQLTAAGAERTRHKSRGLNHFRWLVRYQILGQSHEEIAKAVFAERQAVQAAIRKTSDLIGLPLRARNPSGRPRGARQASA